MSLSIKHRSLKYRSLFFFSMMVVGVLFFSTQQHKAFGEYTSVTTDIYEVLVEKNGIVNIHLTNYTSLFKGIRAQVQYENEKDFKRLRFDADKSHHLQVRNRLGQGRAIALHGKDCEWQFHVYPGQHFLTVNLLYTNRAKSSVYVTSLSPFAVGSEYDDVSPVDNAADNLAFTCFSEGKRIVKHVFGVSEGVVLARNKNSASVLLGGFLTQNKAETSFQVATSEAGDKEEFACFRAICIYDPPVCLLPGESLETEQLYVTLATIDDYQVLERYGAAVAAVNNLKPVSTFIPCGMDVDLSVPQRALDVLEWQKQHVYNYGWNHLTLSVDRSMAAGWGKSCAGCPYDNIKAIKDIAQSNGVTMGIRLSPFLAETEDPLLNEKPEWFLPHAKNSSYKILNVARSDVRDWLIEFVSRITEDCGFRTIVLEDADCLLQAVFSPEFKGTRIQFYRQGLATVRKGMANDDKLVVLPYLPAALPYVDAIGPCATLKEHWSDTYKLDIALQTQAHLYATGVLPYSGSVILENPKDQELSAESNAELHARLMARLTAIALSGASLQLGNLPDNLTQDMVDLLKYVSPPLPHAAFEIGEPEDATTAIRYLPLKTKAGEWHLVAFFNWSRLQSATQSIDLNALGLKGPLPYTLYEFFPGVYHGLLKDNSTLSVTPSNVRLFCLRPYANRPMLLASDRHISQGALDHTDITWNESKKALTGTFNADPVSYCLRFLIPEPWKNIGVMVDGLENTVSYEIQNVMCLRFDVPERKKITWYMRFE